MVCHHKDVAVFVLVRTHADKFAETVFAKLDVPRNTRHYHNIYFNVTGVILCFYIYRSIVRQKGTYFFKVALKLCRFCLRPIKEEKHVR